METPAQTRPTWSPQKSEQKSKVKSSPVPTSRFSTYAETISTGEKTYHLIAHCQKARLSEVITLDLKQTGFTKSPLQPQQKLKEEFMRNEWCKTNKASCENFYKAYSNRQNSRHPRHIRQFHQKKIGKRCSRCAFKSPFMTRIVKHFRFAQDNSIDKFLWLMCNGFY